MLKQIGNRRAGVSSVTQRRWRQLYHYDNHRNVGTDSVEAPVCEDGMKPQNKINDEMKKEVADYFKGGVPYRPLVGYQPNAKIIFDDKTGKAVNIVGLEPDVGFAAYSDYVTGDSQRFFSRPPVKLQYGCMITDDKILAALKAKFSDHSENAVDA